MALTESLDTTLRRLALSRPTIVVVSCVVGKIFTLHADGEHKSISSNKSVVELLFSSNSLEVSSTQDEHREVAKSCRQVARLRQESEPTSFGRLSLCSQDFVKNVSRPLIFSLIQPLTQSTTQLILCN